MAFSVSTTTLGGVAARLVTGTGNLSDLASALSTHGVTISERVITFSGTGANTYYRLDGTLTETRDGVWTVNIGTQSFVCWAGDTAAVTTLGALSSSNSRTCRVDIRYLASSFAVGGDPSSGFKPYACLVGRGTCTFRAGSISYECSSRSDLDVYFETTACTFDAVEVQLTSTGGSYSHILTSSAVVTTANSRFTFVDTARNMESAAGVTTIESFSSNTGLACLGLAAGGTRTVIKPQYSFCVMFGASGGTGTAYDPTQNYLAGLSSSAVFEIYRTIYTTFTDQLGVTISSPAPNLVSLLSGGSPVVTAFSAGLATKAVRQSYVPTSTAYDAAGVGYTDESTYTYYAVGFGYASQYNAVNVKTAHSGNAGITWRASAVKSALVTTAYASVVTSGFALTTGTNTLAITTSRTTNQSAEYLFKLAYDDPSNSYWLSRLHVPATLNGTGQIDFSALNITATGVALSGTTFTTSGNVTLSGGATCSASVVKAAGVLSTGSLASMTGTVTLTGSARWDITTGGTATAGSAAAGNTIRVTSASGGANFDFQAFSFNASTTFENTSGSNITLILASGQTAPTLLPTSGTITISAPLVFQSVTITGVVAGSRVQIYDTTNSLELFNGTSGYSWTDASGAVGTRAIRVRIARQSGTTAYNFIESNIGTCGITEPTKAVNYLASQTLDTVYNANALDGSAVTGISIDDGIDRLIINIGGGSVSWPQIYAYNVYWLTTSAGIVDDGSIIVASDTANYRVSMFKIRNSSATPLSITGGYGVDSSTGTVAPIIDVAGSTGNIYQTPEHVVAYQTTGTYAITGDIATVLTAVAAVPASVLSAAATTPIASDIKKVNNYTISGDGAGSPWGP